MMSERPVGMTRRGRGRLWAILLVAVSSSGALACADGTEVATDDTSEIEAEADALARSEAVLPVDWEILEQKLIWAYQEGLDTLPIGETMVAIGRSFVGTPYRPHTLEIPGQEQLVLNFEALDCVTFVENVLALSRFVITAPPAVLAEPHVYQSYYRGVLRQIRYRGGEIEGYPSRLHYFSEWIADAEAKALAEDLGHDLGGVADTEPIDFMSTHPDAYAQLAETESLERVREAESAISARPRYYLPEARIAEAAGGIRDGDIIAATSTVAGLDIAHTGIALWIEGELHLMHAPLVGEAVQISERTLAVRIQDIGGQDGIMVARPVHPGPPGRP